MSDWASAPYCPDCKSPMNLYGDREGMADVWECDDPDCTFVVVRAKRPSDGWPVDVHVNLSTTV